MTSVAEIDVVRVDIVCICGTNDCDTRVVIGQDIDVAILVLVTISSSDAGSGLLLGDGGILVLRRAHMLL